MFWIEKKKTLPAVQNLLVVSIFSYIISLTIFIADLRLLMCGVSLVITLDWRCVFTVLHHSRPLWSDRKRKPAWYIHQIIRRVQHVLVVAYNYWTLSYMTVPPVESLSTVWFNSYTACIFSLCTLFTLAVALIKAFNVRLATRAGCVFVFSVKTQTYTKTH